LLHLILLLLLLLICHLTVCVAVYQVRFWFHVWWRARVLCVNVVLMTWQSMLGGI
jgi:hypothetical protein